jgi:hypothetical protein
MSFMGLDATACAVEAARGEALARSPPTTMYSESEY